MDPLKQNYASAQSVEEHRPRFLLFFVVLIFIAVGAVTAYHFVGEPRGGVIPRSVIMRLDRETISLVERAGAEPCNVDVANMLASRLMQKSEYAAVLSFLSHMEKQCRLDENLLVLRLHAQKGSSDFAGAETTASALIAEHPAWADAYSWRAEVRESKGDTAGAYEDMRKTLYLVRDPSMASSQVYYRLSHLAAKLGDYCEAVNILRDYVAYDQQSRRTQQVETLTKDWQQKGGCPPIRTSGGAQFRYSLNAKSVVLPVTINGISTRMIVDTGASRTLLTKSLAERAGIRPQAELGSLVATANGIIWQPGGRAEKISLGDATSSNVPVFIQTTDQNTLGNGAEGLLGLSFLGNFKFSMNRGVLDIKPLE